MRVALDQKNPRYIGLGDIVRYNDSKDCLVIKLNGQTDYEDDDRVIRLVNLETSVTIDSFKSLEELNNFTLVKLIAKSNEVKIGWDK